MKLPKGKSGYLFQSGYANDADAALLWEFITDTTALTSVECSPEVTDQLNVRGRSVLQKISIDYINICESILIKSKNTEGKLFPQMQEMFDHELSQIELFKSQLHIDCFLVAHELITESRLETIEWLKKSPFDNAQYSTMGYLTTVLSEQLKYNGMNEAKWKALTKSADWWKPLIDTAGGRDHFLMFAVAYQLWLANFTVFRVMIGSANDEKDPLMTQMTLSRLMKFKDSCYLGKFQGYLILLGLSHTESIDIFRQYWLSQNLLMHDIGFQAQDIIAKEQAATGIVRNEYKTAVKRVGRIENELVETKSRLATTASSLELLRNSSRRAVSDQDSSLELSTLQGEHRKLRSDFNKIEEKSLAQASEIADLKDFISILLESAPEQTENQISDATPVTNTRDLKVIIVGGHERLHTKLRRELPNAVFLHPDQHNFPNKTFENADATLFLVGYCSHNLIWQAVAEVRKNGIPSRYVNVNNVDSVLAELKDVIANKK